MKRNHIDARDRKLLRKVARWRAQHSVNKKKKRIRHVLISFGFLMVASGLIYGIFSQKTVDLQASDRSSIQSAPFERRLSGKIKPHSIPFATAQQLPSTEKVSEKNVNTDKIESNNLLPETGIEKEAAIKKKADEVGLFLTKMSAETNASSGLESVSAESSVDQSRPAEQLEDASQISRRDVRITRLIACDNVVNRQFQEIKSIFSIKNNPTPYVWMDVRSKKLPYSLKHVYYYNDQKYCEVPLSITYPRMRTWSYVSLNAEDHIGNWRVDVSFENGDVLKRIVFQVTQ